MILAKSLIQATSIVFLTMGLYSQAISATVIKKIYDDPSSNYWACQDAFGRACENFDDKVPYTNYFHFFTGESTPGTACESITFPTTSRNSALYYELIGCVNVVEYAFIGYLYAPCPVGTSSNPVTNECVENPADKNEGAQPCSDITGGTNPINISVANKYQIERDYIGAGYFPLEVSRSYNSSRGNWRFFSEFMKTHLMRR